MGQIAANTITITGVDGFVGKHLAREAKSRGFFVRGISRSPELHQELDGVVDEYYPSDLTQAFPAAALSDTVVHLAGLSAVGASFAAPQKYLDVNSSMVTNICETILREQQSVITRVIAVGTGTIYRPQSDRPITEADPIWLASPYAVSKQLIENQIEYYRARGIPAVVVRPFNHIGPGQAQGFLVPDLWARLNGSAYNGVLRVGNLQSQRDYLDVRDVARAYIELAIHGEIDSGIYNVCSGNAVAGEEILRLLCEEGGIEFPKLEVDSELIRPNDPSCIVGSAHRLNADLGWKPEISLRSSIRDFITAAG